MTLNTSVFARTQVDPGETFRFCRELLGATDAHPFDDTEGWHGEGSRVLACALRYATAFSS